MIQHPPYSLDAVLRAAGFTILSRPAFGEPIWRRRGDTAMRQSSALMQVAIEISDGRLTKK